MKANWVLLACVAAGVALAPAHGWSQMNEALLSSATAGAFDESNGSGFPDSGQYAAGKQAIHDGRWADAVAIFGKLVDEGGSHADSAYY